MPDNQDEDRAFVQQASMSEWEPPINSLVHGVGEADEQLELEPIDTDDLRDLETDTESDLLHWTRQPLVNTDAVKNLARQLSPVLIPLPFAAVVLCVDLVLAARQVSFLPPGIMALTLLALAIFQGTLLYFAGSNDTLWLLYSALGYALLIIGGVLVALGFGPALLTLFGLLIVTLLLARRATRVTKEGYVDIVESFGRYSHTLHPGLNLVMPWEKVTQRLTTQELVWTCPTQRVPTSREQHVQLTATISYQLMPEDAHLAGPRWEEALHLQFVGTVQSVVNELSPGDFVSWTQSIYTRVGEASSYNPAAATRWDRINNALSRRMQDQVATHGIQVNWVRIQDLTILPVGGNDGGTTQVMRQDVMQAAAPAPATAPAPKQAENPAPAKVQAAPAPKISVPPGKPLTVEILTDFYEAVRRNAITDPAMILDLAQRFEALARDPVKSETVPFDATRAANTLRQRAQKLQELANRSNSNANGDASAS